MASEQERKEAFLKVWFDAPENIHWAHGMSNGVEKDISDTFDRAIAAWNTHPASVATPADATDEMVEAALAVDWDNEDERATVHNIWHAMTAKLPSSPAPAATDTGLVTVGHQYKLGDVWFLSDAPEVLRKAGYELRDARADLERFWRPISEADKSITFEQTFDTGDGKSMTIRNSDHYWVRDADGRVYEATWSDHKGGYWWDLEGESPVDPVEYMPHPPSLQSAPASEKEKS